MAKEKKYKPRNENARRKNIIGYSFMSPWIIGAILLTFIPFLIAVVMAFMVIHSHGMESGTLLMH